MPFKNAVMHSKDRYVVGVLWLTKMFRFFHVIIKVDIRFYDFLAAKGAALICTMCCEVVWCCCHQSRISSFHTFTFILLLCTVHLYTKSVYSTIVQYLVCPKIPQYHIKITKQDFFILCLSMLTLPILLLRENKVYQYYYYYNHINICCQVRPFKKSFLVIWQSWRILLT